MSSGKRARHEAVQARLLRGLMRGRDWPAGFRFSDAHAASRSLRRARAAAVAAATPQVARALGESFDEHFDDYARAVDPPRSADVRRDAAAFARWLACDQRIAADTRAVLFGGPTLRRRLARMHVLWLCRHVLLIGRLMK